MAINGSGFLATQILWLEEVRMHLISIELSGIHSKKRMYKAPIKIYFYSNVRHGYLYPN